LREPDKLVIPQDVATPQYSWKNKLATNYEAKRTGNMFMPLPGAYELSVGNVPRGPMPEKTTIQNSTAYDSENPIASLTHNIFGGSDSVMRGQSMMGSNKK